MTGIPSSASSCATGESPFPAGSRATNMPRPAATPRTPAHAAGSAQVPPATRHPPSNCGQAQPRQRQRLRLRLRLRHATTISATSSSEHRNFFFDLLDRHTRLTTTRNTDNIFRELSGIRLRHNNICPRTSLRAAPTGKPTQMSPHRAADRGMSRLS